jgi:hypothetical protein
VNWTNITAPSTQYRRSSGIWWVRVAWGRAADGGLGSAALKLPSLRATGSVAQMLR